MDSLWYLALSLNMVFPGGIYFTACVGLTPLDDQIILHPMDRSYFVCPLI